MFSLEWADDTCSGNLWPGSGHRNIYIESRCISVTFGENLEQVQKVT